MGNKVTIENCVLLTGNVKTGRIHGRTWIDLIWADYQIRRMNAVLDRKTSSGKSVPGKGNWWWQNAVSAWCVCVCVWSQTLTQCGVNWSSRPAELQLPVKIFFFLSFFLRTSQFGEHRLSSSIMKTASVVAIEVVEMRKKRLHSTAKLGLTF